MSRRCCCRRRPTGCVGGCGCADRARTMNRWGPGECERRLPTIVGWLRSEAGKRRLPFSTWLARLLVRLAIRRACSAGSVCSGSAAGLPSVSARTHARE